MFSLLKPTVSLLLRPHFLTVMLLPTTERSPTTRITRVHDFGDMFESRTFSAQSRLTSELLRTLSRVAASKQTSWLSEQLYLLSHLTYTLGP
jgi:hypothetical protein